MIKTSREILFANLLVASTNDKIIQYSRINLIYIYNSEFGDLGAHRFVIYAHTRVDHRMTDISPARTNRKQQTPMQPKPGTKSYSIQVRHTPIPKSHENEPEHRCNGNSRQILVPGVILMERCASEQVRMISSTFTFPIFSNVLSCLGSTRFLQPVSGHTMVMRFHRKYQ